MARDKIFGDGAPPFAGYDSEEWPMRDKGFQQYPTPAPDIDWELKYERARLAYEKHISSLQREVAELKARLAEGSKNG